MEAGLAFSSFPGSIGHLLPCPAPSALLQRAPSPPTTPTPRTIACLWMKAALQRMYNRLKSRKDLELEFLASQSNGFSVHCFCFVLFWPHLEACRIILDQGSNPCPCIGSAVSFNH